MSSQRITTFLWFDDNAEEAMNHYISIFKDGKIVKVSRNTEGGPGPEGSVLVGTFELAGQQFMAMNGGPTFKFTEAISLVVNCDTQEEVDYYWEKLSEGGKEVECGWLKDKFGLSWQIVPRILGELMSSPDPEIGKRVMQVVMQTKKFDIERLKEAARQA